MKLYLDDTRDFPEKGFDCCRDADSAILLLSATDYSFISLDYSLGTEQTGLDVLIWMYEHKVSVPHINIHSNHILGRELMRKYAEKHFPGSQITANMLQK